MKTTFLEATGWPLGLPLWIITVEECLNTSIESGTLGCRVTVGGQLRWGRGRRGAGGSTVMSAPLLTQMGTQQKTSSQLGAGGSFLKLTKTVKMLVTINHINFY